MILREAMNHTKKDPSRVALGVDVCHTLVIAGVGAVLFVPPGETYLS